MSFIRSSLRFVYGALQQGGSSDRLRHLIHGPLIKSLYTILSYPKIFKGQAFANAVNLVATMIHNEPSSLSVIQENNLPAACLEVLKGGVQLDYSVAVQQ